MATLTERQPPSPKVSIVICCSPRSGSNFLCEFVSRTGVLGHPAEFLSSKHPLYASRTRSDFVAGMLEQGTSANGVFSCKLFWQQLDEFASRFDVQGAVSIRAAERIIASIVPNPKFVLLTRSDKLRQAISYWRAIVTDAWWRTTDQPSPRVSEIDHAQILNLQLRLETWDRNWIKFFWRTGIPYLRIPFEGLMDSIDNRVRSITGLVGLSPPAIDRTNQLFQRQSDNQTDEIVRRHQDWLASRWNGWHSTPQH